MDLTTAVPSIAPGDFKRTKIIATVGPATDNYESIKAMIAAGANGLRLNFSHGSDEDRDRQIPWIRQASQELGKPVAIIQDLQGPKIRLGDFEGQIDIKAGQELVFGYQSDYAATGTIPMQYDLSAKVKVGERLYLFDGRVRTIITAVEPGKVHARAENDGYILKRKGMNLPDTDFGGDVITEKDKRDIKYGVSQDKDIDYVAQSFIQTADDIKKLRQMLLDLGRTPKLIAKIETKAAVENIEEIVKEADVIMVARGDLAVETPAESVPIVQRRIIELGKLHATPTVVCTQMLLSMTENPEPTRAEVSDVATAVIVGSDVVMLSDETAMGKYPLEAVKTMKRIIRYAEANGPTRGLSPEYETGDMQTAISKSVISLAESVKAAAIVAETRTGATALEIASRRSRIPTVAVTSEVRTAQQLALVYGVKSYIRPVHPQAAQRLTDWLLENKVLHSGDIVVTASGRDPGIQGTTDTIKVRQLD